MCNNVIKIIVKNNNINTIYVYTHTYTHIYIYIYSHLLFIIYIYIYIYMCENNIFYKKLLIKINCILIKLWSTVIQIVFCLIH